MEDQKQNNLRRNILAILTFIVVVAAIAVVLNLVGLAFDWIRAYLGVPQIVQEEQIVTPQNDIPPIIPEDIVQPSKPLNVFPIISSVYTPLQDAFSDLGIYQRESFRIVLNGNFQKAQLHIAGKVINGGRHFLSIKYGSVGGLLNAVRATADTLDFNLTKARGGIFTKDVPIDVLVNLMGETALATTRAEFSLNQQLLKFVNFWNENYLPPTDIRMYVGAFNERGEWGEIVIEKLDFEYSCEQEGGCSVKSCPIGKKVTECLTNNFGITAAKSWCERTKATGCESFLKSQ